MDSIGGYFGLELRSYSGHFHKDALRLHTARMGFEYILLSRHYTKVYLPYYTCAVLLEPLHKLKIDFEYYHINNHLEPIGLPVLQENEAFVYTNYYGLKQRYVEQLAAYYGNYLIVDNAQAFFATALPGIDTIYSSRKFFGVADGCYLYCGKQLDVEIPQAVSFDRMAHLLKRMDIGAEAGYEDFKTNDEALSHQPIMKMSALTEKLLEAIDYTLIKEKRRNNYQVLDQALRQHNQLNLPCSTEAVPMVYPFWPKQNANLKKKLIENKIFVATYWPNVMEWCVENEWEYQLAQNTCFLPVDQRYGECEMKCMIDLILKHIK